MKTWTMWTKNLRRDVMNSLASLPLLPRPARRRILNAFGWQIGDAAVEAGVWAAGPHVVIGDGSFINAQVHFDANAAVIIGRNVRVGPRVMFITSNHHLGEAEQRCGAHYAQNVQVEDGAWIAAGAIILPGVTIGAGSVVAAGSVVTRDVPRNTLVAGTPARVLRAFDGAVSVQSSAG